MFSNRRVSSGELNQFCLDVPNETYCADENLARVGFMHPDDVDKKFTYLGEKENLEVYRNALTREKVFPCRTGNNR